ncbi:ABC Superfamily, partial [Phytophthora palmivora]
MLSHVTQSEEGLVVIRAFGQDTVDRMIAVNLSYNDVNSKAWIAENVSQQWFHIRMQLIGCGVIFVVVVGLVYLRDFLSPGMVGLVFTYALSVDDGLARLVNGWSDLEIHMVIPERIMDYISIHPEGEHTVLAIEPNQHWPKTGTISFQEVVFNYKPGGAPVLKGLSFNIHNNEKIGIVGRTGAGKSSLTMALFRINELVSGRILIDGIDIATMPLRTLRSNLSIIPQSPVLFKGSLRAYMDPFDEFTDADIWSALEKVDMKTQVSELEGQLSYELSENGENFSVGERQMLCMARASLTRSHIVVMDEATASIDHATEKKLQQMINRDFQDATVLTIAHRLATVLESDRIMVLSDGRVVEFDSPHDMMQISNTRQLNQEDLLELDDDSRSEVAYAFFKKHYDQQGQSIARAIVYGYGWKFLLCGLASAFTTACILFAPVVLHHVIEAFSAPEMDLTSLGVWLAAFFASRLVNALLAPHIDFLIQLMVFRLAVSLRALLFEKTMRCSIQSRSDDKAIDITNIYTSDIQRVIQCANEINTLWILPIQIGVVVYMLYVVLGVSAFAGLVVIALSMVIAFFFTKQTNGSYKELMKHKDDRMKLVREVFGAVQIVKFNAWEGKFEEKLLALRELELSALSRFVYTMCGTIFVLWASPLFVSTISFAVYTLIMGQVLTAAKVFTAIALFNLLRDPLREFPSIIQKFLQAKISLNRMAEYLALHEVDPSNVTRNDPSAPDDLAIVIENGTFAWNENADPVLTDINLTVKKGDLVVVYGPVGSGKSSLCSALLGEMEKARGKVSVNGKVAYYSQQPWIQNMTIRENIVFGHAYDHIKYQQVLDVCGLVPDLHQFSGGDETEIGQKGINLSGGQKARVSLARACYSDAEVFILDSPLAAVDAVVQSEIFGKCICGLLSEKTVVLVTHNLDVIES